ncbi:uncharacterized protein LOC114299583 [Camellia sinensis]|uniref:uncharacterized protein LOC114299583 n=1 Tax=Camellia sinensis TaxID=4442 RepID=UPI00103685E8|nr:uncharacterized protein LOC114299583 [Camellia sinensis]
MLLHILILYVRPLSILFSVTPLSWAEWIVVLYLSFPVIIIDEILKFFSRNTSGARFKFRVRRADILQRQNYIINDKWNMYQIWRDISEPVGGEGSSRAVSMAHWTSFCTPSSSTPSSLAIVPLLIGTQSRIRRKRKGKKRRLESSKLSKQIIFAVVDVAIEAVTFFPSSL